MCWQNRSNGRRYYYREWRVGRRILKQFLGKGPKAREAAAEDAAERNKKAQQARRQRQWQSTIDGITSLLDESEQLLKPMLTARLLCGGFRYRNREWRQPRCYRKK